MNIFFFIMSKVKAANKPQEVTALIHNCDDGNAVMAQKDGAFKITDKASSEQIEQFLEDASQQYDAPILYTESCKKTPELKKKMTKNNIVKLQKQE